MDTVYLIRHKDLPQGYIGRTARDPAVRWAEHQRIARKGDRATPLYEALRHDLTAYIFEVLDDTGTITEDEAITAYRADGWTLFNQAGGNRHQGKLHGANTWKLVNEEGMRRTTKYA